MVNIQKIYIYLLKQKQRNYDNRNNHKDNKQAKRIN
jgi:hypothetical protein